MSEIPHLYQALALTRPAEAEELLRKAQAGVENKYHTYEELANICRPASAKENTASAKA
ncbi:MAG: hypothetical protein JO071_06205 [Deltaproteobacteria bacterium]|nr:hypothetical protein [Deltaproteobacteria bacterium]